jgi:Ferric reductase NAD binding domain
MDGRYFYWICRDKNAFEWFSKVLATLENDNVNNFLEINIFLTGGLAVDEVRDSVLPPPAPPFVFVYFRVFCLHCLFFVYLRLLAFIFRVFAFIFRLFFVYFLIYYLFSCS